MKKFVIIGIAALLLGIGLAGAFWGSSIAEAAAVSNTATENSQISIFKSSYFFIPLLLALIALYTLTWSLTARGKITRILHRRIWNLVLLVSTLVSTLLGLILILRLDYGIKISLPFNMLFWHVEAGIVLGVIAVIHIFWHWRYFSRMLKSSPAAEKPARAENPQMADAGSGEEVK